MIYIYDESYINPIYGSPYIYMLHIHVHVYVECYVCVCVCMCIYIYIYMNIWAPCSCKPVGSVYRKSRNHRTSMC